MIHMDAIMDSLSRTMSRTGLMSGFQHASKASSSSTMPVASAPSVSGLCVPPDKMVVDPVSSCSSHSLSRTSLAGHASKVLLAHVTFLDQTSHVFEVHKKAKGSVLMDQVFQHLELRERDYFGLMFHDTGVAVPMGQASDVMRWLDPAKRLRKQLRCCLNSCGNKVASVQLYFRVKFYMSDVSRLQEGETRYLMYLQVKRDLIDGRLTAATSTICLLTSYAVQATLGDFDADLCTKAYLTPFRELLKPSLEAAQTSNAVAAVPWDEWERKIDELHKLHKFQSPAEAELHFLEHARRLEMYGINLHPGKDSNGRDIQLGVTAVGLVVFQNHIKMNTFSWSKIVKISFKQKQFYIQLRKEHSNSGSTGHDHYDTLLGFNLASYRSCKNLWKSAVEHHAFFRLHSPKVPPRRFLRNLGSMFRYSGRTEFQTLQQPHPQPLQPDSHRCRTLPIPLNRSPHRKTLPVISLSSVNTPRSLIVPTAPPAHPATAKSSSTPCRLASPETSSIGSSVHSNGAPKSAVMGINSGKTAVNAMCGSYGSTAVVTPYRGQDTPQSLAHRALDTFNNKVQSFSTKLPKKAWQDDLHSDDEGDVGRDLPNLKPPPDSQISPFSATGGFLDANPRISSMGRLSKASPGSTATSSHLPFIPTSANTTVRFAYADESLSERGSSADGGSHCGTTGRPVSSTALVLVNGKKSSAGVAAPPILKPLTPPKLNLVSVLKTDTAGSSPSASPPPTKAPLNLSNRPAAKCGDADSTEAATNTDLVFISILPDEQGRFGFNVKGGLDQKLPIIVSRVGANTPADTCYPKLNEGDQVVLINGRDVSQHTHDQVVNFIRACSEPHSGQLVLAVRQNVYLGEEVEEPEFQYVPETPHVSPMVAGTQALAQSMLLLEESIESGAVMGQFEQLYRRNTNLTMSICHLPQNVAKNRYRDISPYDSTRVLLTECPSGDYINANHVVMTIPGSGIINRYIATQGPLGGTCTDFWYMTWECQSNLIIMLTTIVERGRIKCHQYWPEVGRTVEYDRIQVTCTKETTQKSFVFRDFTLRNLDKRRKSPPAKKDVVREPKAPPEHHHYQDHPVDGGKEQLVDETNSTTKTHDVVDQPEPELESEEEGEEELVVDEPDEDEEEEEEEEVRQVTQMAYLSWPDHGVPDNSSEFVDFVETVRTHRQGSLYPTIVHCSAGIGRTGVLILMETALYLIEANQPVYPLDLTRIMRDQRASMIQTPSQYKFVCQAILKVYKEAKVKPLPEFCQN